MNTKHQDDLDNQQARFYLRMQEAEKNNKLLMEQLQRCEGARDTYMDSALKNVAERNKAWDEIAILKAERDDANDCALKKMNANHALQEQLAAEQRDKCALAADALNAREALRMVVACIQQPQRCSPDFPKYAVKRANEVLESEIMSVEAISIRRLEAVITECSLALRPFATWDDGGEKDADFAAAERALESCASVLAPVSESLGGGGLGMGENATPKEATDNVVFRDGEPKTL